MLLLESLLLVSKALGTTEVGGANGLHRALVKQSRLRRSRQTVSVLSTSSPGVTHSGAWLVLKMTSYGINGH